MSDMGFVRKEKYGTEDLLEIVRILRAPGGCPWDREQTHKSIRANFIEETYEALEAIDTENNTLLCEELGDVLLQVLLHAQMEAEAGVFDFSDVVDGLAKKLVLRHPHVFGDVEVSGTEDVLRNWDAIKKASKSQKTQTEVLHSVSPALPALMRSEKVQKKAAKSGYDFQNVEAALEKVSEELSEVRGAAKSETQERCKEEIGDLLFSVVNVARHLRVDPEEALSASCEKFIDRFDRAEQKAILSGKKLEGLSEEELDKLWEAAKAETAQKEKEVPGNGR